MEKEKSWNMFFNLQHFKGRKAYWNSRMGLGQIHKWKFKMRLTCKTKKKRQLMQVEWKLCKKLNKNNLKHKLYTAHNLWKETSLPPYNILCASSQKLYPNATFPSP